MAKLTLTDLTSLENQTSALATMADNNAKTEAALENTVSRDGTSPNTMGADFDMNSHRILNLPVPVNNSEPARKADLGDYITTVSGLAQVALGASVSASASASSASGSAASVLQSETNAGVYAASALSSRSDSSAFAALSLGYKNDASGYASSALGYKNDSSAYASTSLGLLVDVSALASTTLGYKNDASGYAASASSNAALALGYKNDLSAYAASSLGYKNAASGYAASALGSAASAALDATRYTTFNNITLEPTGFKDGADVVVSYDSTTRKVTLTGTVEAYFKGNLVSALTSGWVSDAHDTTLNKVYHLYYDGSQFVWSDTYPGFSVLHIAVVHYRTNDKFGQRESHGFLSHEAHGILHNTIGTVRESGGDISSYVLSSTTAGDRRPSISACNIADEDLRTVLPALTNDLYACRYLSGTNTINYAIDNADIVRLSGNNPYYNQWNGSAFVDTLMPANSAATVWLYAVPVSADATSQKYRFSMVQPQWITQAAGPSAAQITAAVTSEATRSTSELNLGDSTLITNEYVAIGKFIIVYTGGNWTLRQVSSINGSRIAQSVSPAGNFLSSVATDDSIDGTGTPGDPLLVGAGAISGKTAITSIDPDNDMVPILDATDGLIKKTASKYLGQAVSAIALRGYIDGLVISGAATAANAFTVNPGMCRDSTNSVFMTLPSAITKLIQGSGSWAAGSGVQGLDTGARTSSSVYHAFLIGKTDGTTDILYSLSSASPTLPSGFTYKRRIFSFRTDSGTNTYGMDQFGDQFIYRASIRDLNKTTPFDSFINTLTISVPTGIKVQPLGWTYFECSATTGLERKLAVISGDLSASQFFVAGQAPSMASTIYSPYPPVITNTSGQIKWSTQNEMQGIMWVRFETMGWIDLRGKDA